MKLYEIIDEENQISIGVLLYYEKAKSFVIELDDKLDEWSAPLLFSNYVKNGRLTIPREHSMMWVGERVIPSNRQNIGDILNTHKLKEYDEMKLLELSQGRCSQDSMYIKKIEELPDYVLERQRHNVCEVVALDGGQLLAMFCDDTIRIISLNDLVDQDGIDKVIVNDALSESVKVGLGGYSITFNDSIDVASDLLYDRGSLLPLTVSDMKKFVAKNIMDTSDGCKLLECSRQNLAYMLNSDQICAVKSDVKGNLYFKGDLIKNMW